MSNGISRRKALVAGASGLVGSALVGSEGLASTARATQGAEAAEPPSPGLARQLEIYMKGAQGVKPEFALGFEELEERAHGVMSEEAFGYVAGGAGSEDTMRANRAAFRRLRLVPKLLRAVGRRDLSVELLGRMRPSPLLVAPIGVQGIIHAEAELATARAARALEIPLVLSTVSSRPLEQVAAENGTGARIFQLYWPRDPELAASFVARAEQAGYEAIVVTLDTYLLAWRPRDLRNAYLPFLAGEGLANYMSDPVFRAALPVPPEQDPRPAVERFAQVFSNPDLTWKDLAFLRERTRLPIVLKGILDVEDARKAVDHGAAAIVVSNHGGRQVDGAVASLEALPRVVEAVGGRVEVLFDSGIRGGADVVKAIALGARAVLVGRPYAYGLAIGGEQGVRDVLLNLLAETDLTLGLVGCRSFAELSREHLIESR